MKTLLLFCFVCILVITVVQCNNTQCNNDHDCNAQCGAGNGNCHQGHCSCNTHNQRRQTQCHSNSDCAAHCHPHSGHCNNNVCHCTGGGR